MQVFGFTINLLTLLAIVLSVGLVVDDAIVVVENVERHLREGMTPIERRSSGRARARRPDYRHDDYARRGLCADRHPGRSDRNALPRVCLHPRRRCHHFRRRRAHALADDVGETVARRAPRNTALPAKSTVPSIASAISYGASSIGPCSVRPAVYAAWIGLRFSRLILLKLSIVLESELAPTEDQGVIFGIVDAPANATIEQTPRSPTPRAKCS